MARWLVVRRLIAGGCARRLAILLAALPAAALLLAACGGGERTLTVFAASSLQDAFREIGAQFEAAHPGVEVRFDFDGSQRLRLRLEQGAQADLFASADDAQIERARVEGTIMDAGAVFAHNVITLVVPAANPADIRALTDLSGRRRVRVVVAGPEVPAGRLTREALAALGLEAAVLAQVVSEEDNVRSVLTKVVLGEADAGFVFHTDALAAGEDVLEFALPEPRPATTYRLAITAEATAPDLARAFVEAVQGAAGRARLAAAGFGPAP